MEIGDLSITRAGIPARAWRIYRSPHEQERFKWILGLDIQGTALDAGCGVGFMSLAVAQKADKVALLDISGKSLAIADGFLTENGVSNHLTFQGSIYTTPFKNGQFDTVCCFETLEHLENPGEAIKELARVLKPGGNLFLSVPAYGKMTHTKGHIQDFTSKNMGELLSAAGILGHSVKDEGLFLFVEGERA